MRDGSDVLRETFLLVDVTSLTGTTPKTRRIYTRQPDTTRRLICSRVIPTVMRVYGVGSWRRPYAGSPTGKRIRLQSSKGAGMHLVRPRAASTSLRTLPASRQNYDPRSVCAVGRSWLHNNEGDSGNCFYVSGIAQRATIASRCCIPAASWRAEGRWDERRETRGTVDRDGRSGVRPEGLESAGRALCVIG